MVTVTSEPRGNDDDQYDDGAMMVTRSAANPARAQHRVSWLDRLEYLSDEDDMTTETDESI